MKKEITLEEWLQIAGVVIAKVAAAVKDDGKISLQDAMSLLVVVISEILKAYQS